MPTNSVLSQAVGYMLISEHTGVQKPMQLNCKICQSEYFSLTLSTLNSPPSPFFCVQQWWVARDIYLGAVNLSIHLVWLLWDIFACFAMAPMYGSDVSSHSSIRTAPKTLLYDFGPTYLAPWQEDAVSKIILWTGVSNWHPGLGNG